VPQNAIIGLILDFSSHGVRVRRAGSMAILPGAMASGPRQLGMDHNVRALVVLPGGDLIAGGDFAVAGTCGRTHCPLQSGHQLLVCPGLGDE